MKATLLLALGLGLAGRAAAQLPAVISAPIAEKSSRTQITHQAVSASLLAAGKKLAGDVAAVSGQIKGVMDQTQQLHDAWYSSLLQVSAGVRNYRRVQEIYQAQALMLNQYAGAIPDLRRRGLDAGQLAAAGQVYGALLQENVGLLSELAQVLSPGRAKMTDPERLEFINKLADQMATQQQVMTYFTSKCRTVAQQQNQDAADRAALRGLVTK